MPHGLWTRSYKDMIDQMAAQGFNTIRLPYSSAMLHSTSLPSGIDYHQNPDLQGLTPIQVMDKIIDYAGRRACGWFSTTTAAPPARAPARTASGKLRSTPRTPGLPTGRPWRLATRTTRR